MSTIQISLNEVSDASVRIKQLNELMYDALSEMKREMDQLNGSWISEAGQQIIARFHLFASRFGKHKSVIDSYVNFLQLTVSSYDSLESTITSNASSIQV